MPKMDETTARLKLRAFLHDPPEKAAILFRRVHPEGGGHETVSADLQRAACLDVENEPVRPGPVLIADWLASGCDRFPIPRETPDAHPVRWLRDPALTHPLAGCQHGLEGGLGGEDWSRIVDVVLAAVKGACRQARGDADDLTNSCDPVKLYHVKLYHTLWRRLADDLVDESGLVRLGELWRLLPADTRIPDHSIWEHNRLTAAIATALPRPMLLAFSVGPVQGFIAQARKCADLWAGSRLLSHLSWQAMRAVAERFGPDAIVYPDLAGQPEVDLWLANALSVRFVWQDAGNNGAEARRFARLLRVPTLPNRFLAIVPADALDDGKDSIVRQAEENVRNALGKAVRAALKELDVPVKDNGNLKTRIDRQVQALPVLAHAAWPLVAELGEIVAPRESELERYRDWKEARLAELRQEYVRIRGRYRDLLGQDARDASDELAASVKEARDAGQDVPDPFQPNAGLAYGALQELLDRAHGAAKVTRSFEGVEEPGRACSLCGEREPLSDLEPGADPKEFWKKIAKAKPSAVRDNERLCAICLAKRRLDRTLAGLVNLPDDLVAHWQQRFPSTATLAVADWVRHVLEEGRARGSLLEAASALAGHIDAAFEAAGKDRADREWVPRRLEEAWLRFKEEPPADVDLDALDAFAHLEGRFLFEENLEPKAFLKEVGVTDGNVDGLALGENLEKARKALGELLREARDARLGAPPRYLAAILADGDGMGRWLSGANAPAIGECLHGTLRLDLQGEAWDGYLGTKRPLSPAYHAALSGALRDFGLHLVPDMVERLHAAQLIYCGGDDLLAFTALSELPRVMANLRRLFRGDGMIVWEYGEPAAGWELAGGYVLRSHGKRGHRLYRVLGPKASISAGVAIFHYKAPLSVVLARLRELEKTAKSLRRDPAAGGENGDEPRFEPKDGVCIGLMKRSGEHAEVVLRQRETAIECEPALAVDEDSVWCLGPVWGAVEALAAAFREGRLSPRLLSAYERFGRILGTPPQDAEGLAAESEEQREARETAFRQEWRAAFRHHAAGGEEGDAKGRAVELADRLLAHLEPRLAVPGRPKDPREEDRPVGEKPPREHPKRREAGYWDPSAQLGRVLSLAVFLARGGKE